MWSLLGSLFRDLWSVLPGRSLHDLEETTALVPNRSTVILVSGFGATERTLSVLRKRLLKDSFNVIVMSEAKHGFYKSAEKLSALILKLRKESPMKNGHVFLLAHSVGGLVARYYVQRLGGSHYTDGLVTLGTPHKGTWYAVLGFLTHLILRAQCLVQMTPISKFIKNVNEAPYPDNFQFCSVYSRSDFMCPPAVTALPKEIKEKSGVQTVELSELSHSDFLMSKRAYLLIRSCLVQMENQSRVAKAS